ncbi:hypothetical protein DSM14862_04153 (plasmid) [Sulfitobacter indolifex]|uniref:Uncharacterized protein n=1 Tax=Sulfitobacter indolifex HEL-45 TaxID=391624 RepID=A0ABM9X1F0_9RHOB|nr:hypothetical protein [Sulfitobacter indolifex]EDQ03263.1 hypothetical protein OIHEL45_16581 [Sulfitobacter indolifex HEL-45]UOA21313.1 hypothetical protein DSM14862_04153 [Sulfitobacter indolifex]
MSPPDANLKKQERRHIGPLIGMAVVVIFGIGIIVYWMGEEVATAPEDEGTAVEAPAADNGASRDVDPAPAE